VKARSLIKAPFITSIYYIIKSFLADKEKGMLDSNTVQLLTLTHGRKSILSLYRNVLAVLYISNEITGKQMAASCIKHV
jgi:hypothetical protein